MSACIRTQIVKIGNSQGIRIPKAVLELVGLQGEVELVVEDDHLLIRNPRQPRQGWEEQFAALEVEALAGESGIETGLARLTGEWEETQWTW